MICLPFSLFNQQNRIITMAVSLSGLPPEALYKPAMLFRMKSVLVPVPATISSYVLSRRAYCSNVRKLNYQTSRTENMFIIYFILNQHGSSSSAPSCILGIIKRLIQKIPGITVCLTEPFFGIILIPGCRSRNSRSGVPAVYPGSFKIFR